MQLLTFTVAGEPYAIESRQVIEVLPRVPARPLPRAADYLLGVFTYRGRLVPLVDLARRLGVTPPAERLSTRVIVAEFEPEDPAPPGAAAGAVRLGLVAENVVAVRAAEQAAATLPPLRLPDADYLGRLLRIGGSTIQLLDVRRLLPAELVTGLLPPAATPGGPQP